MGFRLHEGLLLPYSREDIFPFFASAENLDALTPPWLHFSITTPLPIEMAAGARIGYRIRLRGIPIRWESEITEWAPPCSFTDVQRRGPYRSWVHRHTFAETPDGTLVTDDVSYRVLGGALMNRLFVAGELKRIFAYRKAKLRERFPAPATATLNLSSSGGVHQTSPPQGEILREGARRQARRRGSGVRRSSLCPPGASLKPLPLWGRFERGQAPIGRAGGAAGGEVLPLLPREKIEMRGPLTTTGGHRNPPSPPL